MANVLSDGDPEELLVPFIKGLACAAKPWRRRGKQIFTLFTRGG